MGNIQPQKLGEKYVLLDLIGTGGMAEVFRSKLTGDKGFEKLIVIKRLLAHAAGEPEMVEHFTAEARLAALLEHENIATIYDFGEIEGSCYIAMEYLFGKDLHSIMQAEAVLKTSLDPQCALMIASKICEAMAYAHSLKDLQGRPLNIIHRDLTPHNIFITYEGRVKIIDFGIAKTEMHDNRTRIGVIKGKITYMSPEQISGDTIDSRSDIFSIGMLLYEMFSGRRMYSGDTGTVIRKAIKVEYDQLENIRPGLIPELYEILHKALTISPEDRYQRCDEMQRDIDDCLNRMSSRYEPRLLKAFMQDLFEDEIHREKKRGLKAMHAASLLETESNREKTVILKPEFEKKSSTTLKTKTLLPVTVFLLIFSATLLFFFMKKESSVPEPELPPVVEETKVIQTIVNAPEVRPKDSEKSKKRLIEKLAKQAEASMKLDKLTAPENDSALYYYREIRKIDADNKKARDILKRIAERYAKLAERAIRDKDFREAVRLIQEGLIVSPGHGKLTSLKRLLGKERQRLIRELADQAERCLAENKLTTPVDDNALKYYLDIQKLDQNSVLVPEGFRKIGDRYASLADRAFRRLDLGSARHYVSEGLAVAPNHWYLLNLNRELQKSNPEIFIKSMEKNLKSLF